MVLMPTARYPFDVTIIGAAICSLVLLRQRYRISIYEANEDVNKFGARLEQYHSILSSLTPPPNLRQYTQSVN
ncbi:hypothetical protein M433DRAFT_160194 [Acidomyces richmondensis BFW]|nr:hypothetical protein M433DRAFT_160194 [Acidomyces richmondensis BFW]